MKYLLTLIFLGFTVVNAQNIPNASFEDWTNTGNAGDSLHGWMSSERTVRNYGGSNSVFKGTDPYDGAFSIHLKNVQIAPFPGLFIKGPGTATNGLINFNSGTFQFTFTGGSPDTSRSRTLSYWYKYNNSANAADVGIIRIAKLRYNSSTGIRDTIAWASDTVSAATAYTFRTVQLQYKIWNQQPDSVLIILQSGRGLNDPTIGLDDELVVDSIGFAGWVGIEDQLSSVKGVRMFPQPATDYVNVEVELNRPTDLSYSIYDISGRLVEQKQMDSLNERFSVSSLPAGRYLLNLSDDNGKVVSSSPFSVAH